ncbi:Heparan sulfate 2-O-sulfotransferase 1 [Armadillidium nasatum]|uniref:Heparan sulfate 2-O-sulfotransferase 1 n=1 Tax=Armadillidium nasatum TaxID=96803 RepID=A0A5N5SKB8_9CRUS|nr:Heparan sulfate 2-O-sulfotransferase 1 [Armadillidium nasatum]
MVMLGARLWIVICVVFSLFLAILYLHLSTEISQLRSYIFHKGVALGQSGIISFLNDASDLDANQIIIYNRVPKTGSTSFIGLGYSLCAINRFNVIHINTTKNAPTLSLTDQVRFVQNVSFWEEKKPAIYHGHIAFLDFKRFGIAANPIYINMVRKPIERLISYFYFLRYGDDLRPQLVRKRQGDKMVWQMEEEFYNFARDHFHFIKLKTLQKDEQSGIFYDKGKYFSYEKIKPKQL